MVVMFAYFLAQYLAPQYAYDRKLEESTRALMAKSRAHASLVGRYQQCISGSYARSSRPYCIDLMREFSQDEGLQDRFEEVYLDIRRELWALKIEY